MLHIRRLHLYTLITLLKLSSKISQELKELLIMQSLLNDFVINRPLGMTSSSLLPLHFIQARLDEFFPQWISNRDNRDKRAGANANGNSRRLVIAHPIAPSVDETHGTYYMSVKWIGGNLWAVRRVWWRGPQLGRLKGLGVLVLAPRRRGDSQLLLPLDWS